MTDSARRAAPEEPAAAAQGVGATAPIPAFVNPEAGTADAARKALAADPRFVLHEVPPERLAESARRAVAAGARRVLVAGGDGSIATAAAALAESGAELAVLPGGTLNHFAGRLGIPTEPPAALDVAATGSPKWVAVGYVNERLFLNTSSVGAYVAFVRLRERLERVLGYWLASALAGVRILFQLPRYRVTVEVEGTVRHYRTPLVFIGVGERGLSPAGLGEPIAGGRAGLHVIVVRGPRMARVFALWLAAARDGNRGVERMPEVDSFVVERCTASIFGSSVRVATDGEVVRAPTPLEYRFAARALRVVVASAGESSDGRAAHGLERGAGTAR